MLKRKIRYSWTKYWLLFFALASIYNLAYGQKSANKNDTTVGVYIDPKTGDSLPLVSLEPVMVEGTVLPKMKKYMKEWTRLRNAVYVTYPYAMEASQLMMQINMEMEGVKDPAKRKAIIHSHEKEMKKKFTDKVTNLSVYQGKILMKLIKRQTGNDCYEIIKEYKGNFSAIFWQSVAVVFGSSLKQDYDPLGEDQAMEAIVQELEKIYGNRR